jgi:hypothetical protein
MIVQRIWLELEVKESQTSTYTDVLDIWDSGNLRYERFSNGEEYAWEIVKREHSNNGFTETLKEVPLYKCPFNIAWRETYPLITNSQGFQIPGWSVTQKITAESNPNPGREDLQKGGASILRGRGNGRGRGRGSCNGRGRERGR